MLTGNIVSKTGIVGRLIAVSAVGGLIAAAMALPVVATTGVVLRDQANKAAAPASATFGVLPQRSEIDDNSGHLLAYIYDVNGGKGASYSGIDREPVTFDQISPNMRKAVVAIEDNRYWSEGALDPKGTLRALINDLQHKAVQGGSSITQQYVKNMLILTAPNAQAAQQAYEETLSRKLHELRLAITVAHEQSKQEILTGYLNDAYFGNLAYGIDVAAQTYFGTSPDKLTLPQAAMLAGMVENPSGYDPYLHPTDALTRRNTVLARMVQTGVLTQAQATAAEKTPLGVTHGMPEPGCNQEVAGDSAFFCNYVEQVFLQDTTVAKTAQARAKLLATGGLKIYTTLDPEDQKAAAEAVNYTLPYHSDTYNAFHEADTESMVQPGTGKIEAMAENRPYGPDGTTINYAVDTNYGGGQGIQTGSSSKLFTLVTALEQNTPFGYTATVPDSTTVQGFTNCKGQPLTARDSRCRTTRTPRSGSTTYSLYTATALSINVFYGELEQKVGLCNVVKTAANLGVTWANGAPLLDAEPYGRHSVSADNITSFTLGSVVTSPLEMAGAYATMAARGKYCKPIAISKIVSLTGASLPVPSAGCRQAISPQIADAVNYILQGVLNFPGATGAGLGLNRVAAGKTGTANNSYYAAFGGYTPTLAAYVSVYHPNPPEAMTGLGACFHASGVGQQCDSEMFGADAPGHTWQLSFEHANLGRDAGFVGVPDSSPLNSQGNGQSVKQKSTGGKGKGKGKGKGGNGNGNGGGGNTGTTTCIFNFCTGSTGGNNGGPTNASTTAFVAPGTTGLISPLALFAREE